MSKFIEVTHEDGMTMLLAVDRIKSVIKEWDGTVFIEIDGNGNGNDIEPQGVWVKESYAEIKKQLFISEVLC